ncbi:hypothetical protein [Pseudarthrobacter sp. efr-133-R2A-89]|uniref:hypothetical protein n=1 Tax=Pseudarthrobacter sp. efr-133-R2A-89 TaxID=3040302 RepID=UPI00255733F2|nr:hypothetical protein [Pseudarthrobacter sp. efr-133-R2A-89]
MNATCYIPIQFLSLSSEMLVLGVTFLPPDDERIPYKDQLDRFDKPVHSVAAIQVSGDTYEDMVEVARASASQALRKLRIAIGGMGFLEGQRRFRLGTSYTFDDGSRGWSIRDDAAHVTELNSWLAKAAETQALAALPEKPFTDIEKKAETALRWMERASLTGDATAAMLYLVFALESLLGDKSEGAKGHKLAFLQAALHAAQTGTFQPPEKTLLIYSELRSAAVHGEHLILPVTKSDVQNFSETLHQTLNLYLSYAAKHGLGRRGKLMSKLQQEPIIHDVREWLRANGGPGWIDYLDRTSASETAE